MFSKLTSFIEGCTRFFLPNTSCQFHQLSEHYNCYRYFIEVGNAYKASLTYETLEELPPLKNSRIISQLGELCENSPIKRGLIASALGIKADKLLEHLNSELKRAIEIERELQHGNNSNLLEYATQVEQIKIMVAEGIYGPSFSLTCSSSSQYAGLEFLFLLAGSCFVSSVASNGMATHNLPFLAGAYSLHIAGLYALHYLSYGLFNFISWYYDFAEIRLETHDKLEHLRLVYSNGPELSEIHQLRPYGTDEEMQMDEYTPTIGELGWVF